MTPLVLEDSRHVTGKGHFALGHGLVILSLLRDLVLLTMKTVTLFANCILNASPSAWKQTKALHVKRLSMVLRMTINYLPYQKTRDLIVTDPCTPSDHILTDHSINTIISAMWEGPDYTKFYNDIGEEEASFFFSRHQNGRYSDMAVKEFGFPNDTTLTTGASHPDLTSNNVTNHALLISNASYTDGTQSKRPAVILPSPKKRARILGHETHSQSLS
ncbi:hypothetical protein IV203_002941 [Nitzschia inconspicua]|uniref:Uncharacterized protein n=1 Tax=Nitzschia inconspicua TaxID=303405 RepID=A0A9K3L2H2_9STRA|nr:hypothetical protein IV203_002941 [Nitzschia inconspicua]